ncbi:pyrimidine reductase [Streptomyces inusitatus]|uniref:Pyrimidine reductase n=1 Tax=Streptomyces inusitatus TaxID=68221 RepID=A0A918PLE4_9ACTN|nr:dihydrofolate reductase family protein [Streptomyces inusitatus]GGZ14546.1 pyrimidine reductase [Streptomyces inusitatus]
MRKLVETTFVTLDGVIGSPEKWSAPYWDEEYSAHSRDLLFAADSLLLGRETYEGFAEVWPRMEEVEGEYAVRINSMPKHVASRTLTEAKWNATVIAGDVAEEVAALKALPGRGILKFGTGELDRTLLEHRLVDEYHFWMFPVIAGGGDRLLDGIDTAHLKLVESKPLASGVVLLTYTPR